MKLFDIIDSLVHTPLQNIGVMLRDCLNELPKLDGESVMNRD